MDRLKQHLQSCSVGMRRDEMVRAEEPMVLFDDPRARGGPVLCQMLQDQGITAADLPKAIVFHEVLGAGMAIGFWWGCYNLQPSRTVMRPLAQRASKNALARKSYDAAVQSAQKTMQRLPWLQKIGDPGRLTASLAESICVRASIKPATFPFKIWASYRFVKMTKRHERGLL